jgi:putative FmdB family regulatory protein
MPTYQFTCPRCDAKADVIATLTEDLIAPKCEKCKELMLRKYDWQTTRFIGSGWAKNDS